MISRQIVQIDCSSLLNSIILFSSCYTLLSWTNQQSQNITHTHSQSFVILSKIGWAFSIDCLILESKKKEGEREISIQHFQSFNANIFEETNQIEKRL